MPKTFISSFTWKAHKFNSHFYPHIIHIFISTRAGSIYKKHLHHSHFTGTIQVMKAVATHLVLTFCERNELFTVILTRTKTIAVDVSTLSYDIIWIFMWYGFRGLIIWFLFPLSIIDFYPLSSVINTFIGNVTVVVCEKGHFLAGSFTDNILLYDLYTRKPV